MKSGLLHTKWRPYRERNTRLNTLGTAYYLAMKSVAPHQSTSQPVDNSPPELEGFEIKRPPFVGFGLLMSSVIGTLAVLIYFGAWASSDRIENRAHAAGIAESQVEGQWWENGLVNVCPLH